MKDSQRSHMISLRWHEPQDAKTCRLSRDQSAWHYRNIRPEMSALSDRPCTISASTHPVPRLLLMPHGPCPAARNTPPSAPGRVEIPRPRCLSSIRSMRGDPVGVMGRKHRPSLTTLRSPGSASEPSNAVAVSAAQWRPRPSAARLVDWVRES
jgi:hypothetical protein